MVNHITLKNGMQQLPSFQAPFFNSNMNNIQVSLVSLVLKEEVFKNIP